MSPARYIADPLAARPSVDHEGLTILYHRPSGVTHVVSPPVPELLGVLEEGPADAAGIVARLSARHDVAGAAR